MKISVLTIFPSLFDSFLKSPVIERAIKKGLLDLEILDIKEYADGCFRKIDDSPYGGGPGMILRVDTLCQALDAVKTDKSKVVLFSPKGCKYNQIKAHEYKELEHLILVCGHYEGVDARFESYVDEMLSIGDYVMTGGELAAQVVCDSVVRLIKGSLRDGATEQESFENGLLEYPQYTHPYEFRGVKVPDILLSGNHGLIEKWKQEQAVSETQKFRPDML
ncbi:MAG: tRNA (guanosine(37)-N1)-methyltransferase TrmD [Sphaerochaetaceae bacterium]|nr:tRNA (guanosine(37)-N1)-methyltransferase TrmD [Sphaerochaetaceae bacterium]